LNTESVDVEYEVSRCRPLLDDAFFATLDAVLGQERFAPDGERDEDRIAELESLRGFLEAAAKALDAMTVKAQVVASRLRDLLSSKDKKEHILGMVERNEVDAPLMALLAQNIEAARAGGQDDAVAFMEKVKGALSKYLVTKVKAVA
jgi:hypothetical protein